MHVTRDSSESHGDDHVRLLPKHGRSSVLSSSVHVTRDSSESHGDDDVRPPPKHGRSSVPSSSVHVTRDSSESHGDDHVRPHQSMVGHPFLPHLCMLHVIPPSRTTTSMINIHRGVVGQPRHLCLDHAIPPSRTTDPYPSLRGRLATSLRGSRDSSKSYDYNFVQPPSIRRRAATYLVHTIHPGRMTISIFNLHDCVVEHHMYAAHANCEPQSQSSVDDSDSDDDHVPTARESKPELVSSSGSVQVALSSNTEHKLKWDKNSIFYCIF